MSGNNTSSPSPLDQKRKDLYTLIEHIKTIEVNAQNEPVIKCVVSRLMAELRRAEVEEMYHHIQSCPGLSSDSAAFSTAIPALNEAAELIAIKEKNMQVNLLLSPQLGHTSLPIDINGSSSNVTATAPMTPRESIYQNAPSDNGRVVNESKQELTMNAPVTREAKKLKKKRTKSTSWLGTFIRSLFLDLPYAVTVFILIACICAKNMYFTFLVPVMDSVQWTRARMETEYTGYRRECDASDISTTNVDDLIIDPETMTPKDALDVTNKHGMSIFPNILTAETAEEMRKWVLHRNANLNEDDEIPLISNKQRWSFPIGADEDPSVPPVLKEIATHVMLQDTMDLIFDEDPALVEFTAITSAYGAGDQHWHADNDFQGSQMHYARSFVPMYSLFIPLQDTTAKMGATSACPGTHLCGSEDRLDQLCDDLNFQVDDTRGRLAETEEDHTWKSGDGFLFHLNTYHRGPGHTDPNGIERVMLIMTISNRPKGPYFDRRQISLGTSYSNKWDMWGLTMKDLANIDQTLGFPWKYLRTYGIWKPKVGHRSHDVKWGWDYITVACSRIMNDQMGFRYDDLELFVKKMNKRGPLFQYLFGFLPEEGGYDEDTMSINNGWRDYFPETLRRFISVASILYGISCFFYVIVGLIATGPTSTFKRLLVVNSIIGLAFYGWFNYISNSPWGKGIISKSALESPFSNEVGIPTEVTVVPTKNDILFNERLNSPFLAGMNIIHDQQPGNAKFNELLSKNANMFSKEHHVPSNHRRKVLEDISKTISKSGGRILKSNAHGDWYVPSEAEKNTLVTRTLISESNEVLKSLYQQMLFLKSECLYSRFRKTAMMKVHAMANLENFFKSMYDLKLEEKTPVSPLSLGYPRLFVPTFDVHNRQSKNQDKDKPKTYIPSVGDHVEYYFDGDGWFQGRVQQVNRRRRTVAIQFFDGDFDSKLSLDKVRLFQPYQIGERIAADGGECNFTGVSAFGNVRCSDSGEMFSVDINQVTRLDTGVF